IFINLVGRFAIASSSSTNGLPRAQTSWSDSGVYKCHRPFWAGEGFQFWQTATPGGDDHGPVQDGWPPENRPGRRSTRGDPRTLAFQVKRARGIFSFSFLNLPGLKIPWPGAARV